MTARDGMGDWLSPATSSPIEPDALLFDVALTVAAMRCISDLRMGKAKPRHLDARSG
jgi:hypothetical protein